MKKAMVAVAVSAMLVGSGYAMNMTPVKGGFIGAGFGEYFTDSARDLTNSMGVNMTAGYHFNSNLALQGTGIMMGPSENSNENRHYNSYFLGLEGVVTVPTQTALDPFFGFGFGDLKVKSTSFAPDLLLGTNFNLSHTFGINLTLRHFIQMTGTSNYNDNYLSVGATWSFGQPAVVMPAAQVAPVKTLTASQAVALNSAKKELKDYLPQGVHQCGHDGATPETGCVTLNGNQVTMHLNVRFVKAKANLQGQFTPAINKLGKFMNQYPTTQATLFGYASSDGVLSFNQKLSLWRAQSVKTYLVSHDHIDAARLKPVGMGIKDPIASNATEAGRTMNRRVEAAVSVNVPS